MFGLFVLVLLLVSVSCTERGRENAVIVVLARNSDLQGLKYSLTQFEFRFNSKYHYPYVFLNDVPFSEEFKTGISAKISGKAEFGLIPSEHWSYPEWIDVPKADEARKAMEEKKVIYGGSLSYRHMCRYNSGFFFRHPLLLQYDYYWRVEPDVEFTCNIDYDPFTFMRENGKEYGFTITLKEIRETIPTFWSTTKKFMEANKDLVHPRNFLDPVFTDYTGKYNMCHFWSNFEIASFKFLRSEAYLKYFDYLDKAGGFFYERWGDAPVHSIAAGMFLPIEKIHFFEDIGYLHAPFQNCPAKESLRNKCTCNGKSSYNKRSSFCHQKYLVALVDFNVTEAKPNIFRDLAKK